MTAYIYIYIYIDIDILLPFKKENGKWKPRQFSFIRSPLAHRANGSSLFVFLFTKKQTEVIRLQTD